VARLELAASSALPPFAVPEKIFVLALILDFFDRCTQNALLLLPPAAQSVLAQSRYPALLAGCRWWKFAA